MEEWKEYSIADAPLIPLTDLVEFIVDNRGKTVPTSATGIKLIATNCIRNEYLYPLYEKVRYVTKDTYNTWFRSHPKPGDIIFVNKGTPGKTALVPNPVDFCIAQDMMAFRLKSNLVYNRYLLAVLRSRNLQNFIMNNQVGTIIPHFKKEQLKTLMIPLPDICKQRKIGDLYFHFSEKAEVNRRINENLEQQAQALFKSWFVDFEPFKNGEFVESELGRIPKGWRVGRLFDVAEIFDKIRKPLSSRDRENMDRIYPYYGATSCMDYVDNYLFDGIYTLIGEDGSVVKEDGLPYMQYVWGKFWVNNHAHILQGKNGFSTEMIHVMLSITNIQHLVTGAVQAKLSQANMQKILVALPPIDVINKIRPLIDKLYQKRRNLEDENSRLAELRDTLLPKLMSGELKVNEIA
jgi:type I restriction enzyme S subunit